MTQVPEAYKQANKFIIIASQQKSATLNSRIIQLTRQYAMRK